MLHSGPDINPPQNIWKLRVFYLREKSDLADVIKIRDLEMGKLSDYLRYPLPTEVRWGGKPKDTK